MKRYQFGNAFVESIGFIVVVVAIIAAFSFGSYALYAYFNPKYTAVQNQTFKESQAYNDGMIRDLEDLQAQYASANSIQKDALRAIILHRFSVYPENKLSPTLRNFYNDIKAGRI